MLQGTTDKLLSSIHTTRDWRRGTHLGRTCYTQRRWRAVVSIFGKSHAECSRHGEFPDIGRIELVDQHGGADKFYPNQVRSLLKSRAGVQQAVTTTSN
jgi:hypothetical protein